MFIHRLAFNITKISISLAQWFIHRLSFQITKIRITLNVQRIHEKVPTWTKNDATALIRNTIILHCDICNLARVKKMSTLLRITQEGM